MSKNIAIGSGRGRRKHRNRELYDLEYDYPYPTIDNHENKSNIKKQFLKPKNSNQIKYQEYLQNHYPIIIATGPAGTGKTLFATTQAINDLVDNKIKKIVLTRPTTTVDEDLGYLPGSIESKMDPWIKPIFDIFHNYFTQKEINELIEEQVIEIVPLGFMRGRTFSNTWIIADEMQNSTISQMKMILTRIGSNSRMVITGDLCQTDDIKSYGLSDFLNKYHSSNDNKLLSNIKHISFGKGDIERHHVISSILNLYENKIDERNKNDISETKTETLSEIANSYNTDITIE